MTLALAENSHEEKTDEWNYQGLVGQLGQYAANPQWHANQLAGLGLQYGAPVPYRQPISHKAIGVYRRARKWRRVLRVIQWMVNLC